MDGPTNMHTPQYTVSSSRRSHDFSSAHREGIVPPLLYASAIRSGMPAPTVSQRATENARGCDVMGCLSWPANTNIHCFGSWKLDVRGLTLVATGSLLLFCSEVGIKFQVRYSLFKFPKNPPFHSLDRFVP
jgi:hypothetical protein